MDPMLFIVATFVITCLAVGLIVHLANGGEPWSRAPNVTWREAHERAETLLKEMLTGAEYDQLFTTYADVSRAAQGRARGHRRRGHGGRVPLRHAGRLSAAR